MRKMGEISFICISLFALWLGTHYYTPTKKPFNNWIEYTSNGIVLHSLYGNFPIQSSVLQDALKSPCINRLKKVYQYGIFEFIIRRTGYTRYDHSLGVLALLLRYGAPEIEQLAGLFHDASHTAFSHSVGCLFNKEERSAAHCYQDDHHEELLRMHGIEALCGQYNITLSAINPKKRPDFTALEQELNGPCGICADRLEYILHGSFREGMLTQGDIDFILNNLRFENGLWFFESIAAAQNFARAALNLPLRIWKNKEIIIAEYLFCTVLQKAIHAGILSREELLTSTDKILWGRLSTKDRQNMQTTLKKIIAEQPTPNFVSQNKFHGINPLVRINGKLMRLTDLDAAFKKLYQKAKSLMQQGILVYLPNLEAKNF